jgi:hypothetical protein
MGHSFAQEAIEVLKTAEHKYGAGDERPVGSLITGMLSSYQSIKGCLWVNSP